MADVSPDTNRYQGALSHDGRFCFENVQAKGAGSTDSAYTQRDPIPGVPEPDQETDLVLETSGSISEDRQLTIKTMRAGHPGFGEASFTFMVDGDTSEPFGWDGFQIATGFEILDWVTTGRDTQDLHIIRLQSGKLLVAGIQDSGVGSTIRTQRYRPDLSTWSELTDTPVGPWGANPNGPCLLELPDGTILLFLDRSDQQVDVYFSEDEGTTWEDYSFKVLRDNLVPTANIQGLRAAYSNGQVSLLIWYIRAGGEYTLCQYGSDDFGMSFDLVEQDFWLSLGSGDKEQPRYTNIVGKPEGGFVVAYWDADDDPAFGLRVRQLASAYDALSDAETTHTDSFAGVTHVDGLSLWFDEDGILHLLHSVEGSLAGLLSMNYGYTFEEYEEDILNLRSSTEYFKRFAACSTGGRAALVTRWDASVDPHDHESVAVIWLGGFSSHTVPAGAFCVCFQDHHHITWDRYQSTQNAMVWFPIEKPHLGNQLWGVTGAGSEAIVSPGHLEVTTVGTDRYYSMSWTDAEDMIFAEIEVELDDGDGSRISPEVAICIEMSDNSTYRYRLCVCLASDGYGAYDDLAPGALSNVSGLDLTSLMKIRVAVDRAGNWRIWHARDAQVRSWTHVLSGSGLTNSGTGNNIVEWGHFQDASNISRWNFAGFNGWAGAWTPDYPYPSEPCTSWSATQHLHPRAYSTRPYLIYDGVRLAAVAGPSRLKETQQIHADYKYPLSSIFPDISPSPDKQWRVDETGSDIEIVFDIEPTMDADSLFMGYTLGAFLFGCNFKTAQIQKWTGAAWVTVLDLDASNGYSGLKWQRKGRMVYPHPGVVSSGDQYLWYGQHIGDTFDLEGDGDDRYRKISRNTEGAWTGSGVTGKKPVIELDEAYLTGLEDQQNTLGGSIWSRDFGGVVHIETGGEVESQIFRLRIPDQMTADGSVLDNGIRLGTFMVGHVAIFGHQYDRGWGELREHNSEGHEREGGSDSYRKRGKVRREYSFRWANTAVHAQQAQVANPNPDYVQNVASTGYPVATRADTLRMLEGLLEESDGPVKPLVLIPRIPRDSGTIKMTDRRQFILARVITDTTRESPYGSEQVDETEKMNEVVFREII